MLKKSLFITTIISVFLSSCGSIAYTNLQSFTPNLNKEKELEVYYTQKPDRKFKEVAKFEFNGFEKGEAKTLQMIKDKAKEVGVDAIIIIPPATTKETSYTGGLLYGHSESITKEGGMRAIGIIYE